MDAKTMAEKEGAITSSDRMGAIKRRMNKQTVKAPTKNPDPDDLIESRKSQY